MQGGLYISAADGQGESIITVDLICLERASVISCDNGRHSFAFSLPPNITSKFFFSGSGDKIGALMRHYTSCGPMSCVPEFVIKPI